MGQVWCTMVRHGPWCTLGRRRAGVLKRFPGRWAGGELWCTLGVRGVQARGERWEWFIRLINHGGKAGSGSMVYLGDNLGEVCRRPRECREVGASGVG